VKSEDVDPLPRIDFISILGASNWSRELSLHKHSGLGSVDLLPLLVTLTHARGRRNWCVELKVSSFAAGWDRFVHDSGLLHGNILQFRYLGDGHFSVSVWNNLWCRVTMSPDLM
jgi:hypothetical protein